MSETSSPFDFENYQPSECTPIVTPRRGFLRALRSEIHAYSGKTDGIPTMKLANLATLQEEDLLKIMPVKAEECKISLREKMVWALLCDEIEPVVLFPVDSPALRAFNLFDGYHTLEEISRSIMDNTTWSEEKARAYTRGLFIKLVNLRVCVPK